MWKKLFGPGLSSGEGITNISFYKKAFGAAERGLILNDDGSKPLGRFGFDLSSFN